MARRRLLTILASSAVLTAGLAGPAAAIESVDPTGEAITEVAAATSDDGLDEVVASVESVDVPVVADVADEVEGVVAPQESPSETPESTGGSEQQAAPVDSATDEPAQALVTAGGVDAAPALVSLTGPTGIATREAALVELQLSLSNPAPAAAPVADVVEAPQVAPADVAETAAKVVSVVQSATSPAQDGGTSIVAVALASLLAAGLGMHRGGREAASA